MVYISSPSPSPSSSASPSLSEAYNPTLMTPSPPVPQLENTKRLKLKDLNTFVSTTRLSVHNLPTRVDDAELKRLFYGLMKQADQDAVGNAGNEGDEDDGEERPVKGRYHPPRTAFTLYIVALNYLGSIYGVLHSISASNISRTSCPCMQRKL